MFVPQEVSFDRDCPRHRCCHVTLRSIRAQSSIYRQRAGQNRGSREGVINRRTEIVISYCSGTSVREPRQDAFEVERTLQQHVQLGAAFQFVERRYQPVLPRWISCTHESLALRLRLASRPGVQAPLPDHSHAPFECASAFGSTDVCKADRFSPAKGYRSRVRSLWLSS